jgi:hypothetical protein
MLHSRIDARRATHKTLSAENEIKMFVSILDESDARLHNLLSSLDAQLKFNIALTRDSALTKSELLRLLNRHRLRESAATVRAIFTALGSRHDAGLADSLAELWNILELARVASDAKHRCRTVRKEKEVVACIRRLSRQYRDFCLRVHVLRQG